MLQGMAAKRCSPFPGHPGTAQHTSGAQMRVGPHCQSTEACTHTRLRQAPRKGTPVPVLTPTAETGSALFHLHTLLPLRQLCLQG